MSKGGAGKVYFVLYLAVILELLIIIVERDEAEEHLIQKQKETMRIVESILSQLQTGPGSEGISTRPQDEITIQEIQNIDGGPKIKQDRTYYIEVGVTELGGTEKIDPNDEPHIKEEKRVTNIQLANVQDLEYQIFYHTSQNPDRAPHFPTDDQLGGIEMESEGQIVGDEVEDSHWRLQFVRKIELEHENTDIWHSPVYGEYTKSIGNISEFAPQEIIKVDSVFRYNHDMTLEIAADNNNKFEKRVFQVHFKAPTKPGWYKLRLASRTNKILGLNASAVMNDLPDDASVNIGTVKLKIKDLRKVKKELDKRLEGMGMPSADLLAEHQLEVQDFDDKLAAAITNMASENSGLDPEDVRNTRTQMELYGYIAKLLAPGKSFSFPQNQGSIEIDIRVIKPPVNIAEPYVELPPDGVFVFDQLKPAFTFTSGPFQGNNFPEGHIVSASGLVPLTISPIDNSADASGSSARGVKRFYRAIASQPLEPGAYRIEMTQKNASKTKTEECVLEVYPTKLVDDNNLQLQSRMNNLYYGNSQNFNAIPSSRGKIPPEQFRLYARLDGDPQVVPVRGLATKLPLPASANSASLRVSWVSPYTSEEVDLLPEISGELKQGQPFFDISSYQVRATGSSPKKFKVLVSGIQVQPVFIDTGFVESTVEDLMDVQVVGDPTVSFPGYELSDAYVEEEGDATYRLVVELTGSPINKREKEVTGYLTATLSVAVRNPRNQKVSEAMTQPIEVSAEYTLPKRRRGGRR